MFVSCSLKYVTTHFVIISHILGQVPVMTHLALEK